MAERLNDDARAEALDGVDGWTMAEGREAIQKSFRFKSFKQAFGFMVQCAMRAEQLDHHPEWFNVYNRVDVTLATHDANGLTELDFRLAAFMNKTADC